MDIAANAFDQPAKTSFHQNTHCPPPSTNSMKLRQLFSREDCQAKVSRIGSVLLKLPPRRSSSLHTQSLHSMVAPTLTSILVLFLSPKLSFATDSMLSGWQRTPKNIRCRPSVTVEAGTCRKRTFGGATQAVLDASLVAGLSITIPIPQLETEALFYTPFSFAVQVSEAEKPKN